MAERVQAIVQSRFEPILQGWDGHDMSYPTGTQRQEIDVRKALVLSIISAHVVTLWSLDVRPSCSGYGGHFSSSGLWSCILHSIRDGLISFGGMTYLRETSQFLLVPGACPDTSHRQSRRPALLARRAPISGGLIRHHFSHRSRLCSSRQ